MKRFFIALLFSTTAFAVNLMTPGGAGADKNDISRDVVFNGKTLDVSSGTLELADGQIPVVKIEGAARSIDPVLSGTVTGNLTPADPTSWSISGTGVADFSSASIGDVTAAQIGYLSGLTSDVQTQLNLKPNFAGSNTFSGTQTITDGISTTSIVAGEITLNAGGTATINPATFNAKAPLNSPTFTGTVVLEGAVNFPDDVRQTFNPGATTPGLNFGSYAGIPSTTVNGDVWYDTTATLFRGKVNSVEDSFVMQGRTMTLFNKTLSAPAISGSITFPANTRQTFAPGATVAGLNVGSAASAPSTPSNGDLWYDTGNASLRAQVNGVSDHVATTLRAQTLINKTLTSPVVTGGLTATGDLTVTASRVTGAQPIVTFNAGKSLSHGGSVGYIRDTSDQQLLVSFATDDYTTTDGFFGTITNQTGRLYFLTTNGSTGSFAIDQTLGLLVGTGQFTNTYGARITPAGAYTGASFNGNTITTGTGTLTLGAGSTLATSATNSITLTSTGATNVTLPTTGTLATRAGTETFTNKTLTSPVINGEVTGTISLPSTTTIGLLGLQGSDILAFDGVPMIEFYPYAPVGGAFHGNWSFSESDIYVGGATVVPGSIEAGANPSHLRLSDAGSAGTGTIGVYDNKLYVSGDYAYILNPQGLTARREFTFPDTDGTFLVDADSSVTSSPGKILKLDEDGLLDVSVFPTEDINIAFQRGTETEVDSVIIGAGVPAWATDTHRLTIGDGTTLGGTLQRAIQGFTSVTSGDPEEETIYMDSDQLQWGVVDSGTWLTIDKDSSPYGKGFSFRTDGNGVFYAETGGGILLLPDTGAPTELTSLASKIRLSSISGVEITDVASGIGGTTEAQGLWFGDDSVIYRSGAGTIAIGSGDSFALGGRMLNSVGSRSGAGAVPLPCSVVELTTTGSSQALSLADGVVGQSLTIIHVADGGSAILTPTTKTGYSTITFTDVGDSVSFVFLNTRGWMVTSVHGAVVTP